MDHIVYLDARARELDNLINGNKSMIVRGAAGKKLPYGRVKEGDILYFINNNGDGEIRGRGIVRSVYDSGKLSVEESFEMIIRHQDRLQLPDRQFEKLAGKRYLVLIGLSDVIKLDPIRFDRSSFSNMDDWFPVGNIQKYMVNHMSKIA